MRILASLLVLLAACHSSGTAVMRITHPAPGNGPRVLGIVAHPDDETAFAAALYKISTHLDGACDLAVITNGEGGFKYATLAERLYGLELTDEAVGRAHLPAIRTAELAESCRILGVRDLYLLHQTDHRFTTDVNEVLGPDAQVWDLAFVRAELDGILEDGDYDFVFTLAPTVETHAHHKAATLLALERCAELRPELRPIVLCANLVKLGEARSVELVPGFSRARLADGSGPFVFDRRQTFGFKHSLDYRVLVNLAIAAHKSQGTMQLAMNEADREEYWLFADEPANAEARTRALFESLRTQQYPARTYGASAGTNARP